MCADQTVARHYGREDLTKGILEACEKAGVGSGTLKPDDLAPIDEFHVRGLEATREMVALSGFNQDSHVLDVGSGIGGPSRQLANLVGCHVTGIDLTPEYCETATALAKIVGLQDRVNYDVGDALDMPYEDGTFDGVWTLHVTMNIADKLKLLHEIRRVLRNEGRLVMYEIIAGPAGDVYFPVPWADDASISYLSDQASFELWLDEAGFRVDTWRDVSKEGVDFFRASIKRNQEEGVPPRGLHVLVGPEMKEKGKNVLRSLDEDRIRLVQIVASVT